MCFVKLATVLVEELVTDGEEFRKINARGGIDQGRDSGDQLGFAFPKYIKR